MTRVTTTAPENHFMAVPKPLQSRKRPSERNSTPVRRCRTLEKTHERQPIAHLILDLIVGQLL